jgi:Glycosyltransferase GT-D fold/Methyltransferase domain
MKYPAINSEMDTLDKIIAGNSIARYGDGEWRCAIDGACTSQRADKKMAGELRAALKPSSAPKYIVGIPNPFHGCPREESWVKYTEPRFSNLLESGAPYYSSFITRPDNAPWIDTKEYWAKVEQIWADKDVVLVVGDKKSLTSEMIERQCRSFSEVYGPRQHAYAEIDRIEQEIISRARGGGTRTMEQASRILLCLGATATVLAHRLAKRGFHAIDLGHIGMFMRHAGAYHYAMNDLTSQGYRMQLEKLHTKQRWGADGAKHVKEVKALCDTVQPATILDYGCGENKLAEAMKPVRVQGYDPGIPERAKMPKPCDLVICTDVLEHVEPTKIDAVLDHIYRLTAKCAYMVISMKPANAVLLDGRNAHLIVEQYPWWETKLKTVGWSSFTAEDRGKELRVTAWK